MVTPRNGINSFLFLGLVFLKKASVKWICIEKIFTSMGRHPSGSLSTCSNHLYRMCRMRVVTELCALSQLLPHPPHEEALSHTTCSPHPNQPFRTHNLRP